MVKIELTQKTTENGEVLAYWEDASFKNVDVDVDSENYDVGSFRDRDYDVRRFVSCSIILDNRGPNKVNYTILGATKDFDDLDTDLKDGDFTEVEQATVSIDEALGSSGEVICAGVLAGDTVTVNGLVYTAVNGTKSDNTEFDMSGTDTATAADLADSITNDDREGLVVPGIDQTATSAVATVTITASQATDQGNVITLASSDGVRLAVSGATLENGFDGRSAIYNLQRVTPAITALRVRIKEFTGGQPSKARGDCKFL